MILMASALIRVLCNSHGFSLIVEGMRTIVTCAFKEDTTSSFRNSFKRKEKQMTAFDSY